MSQLLRGKGMFPYPVQKHFSLEINILLVLLFVCIILSLYYFVKGLFANRYSDQLMIEKVAYSQFANKYSDQLMIEKVAQIYNISQLALWGWILIKIVKQTIEEDNDSTSIDCWVKLAQTTQVMDLVFNFIGHTKGSLMNNILQLGGRLLVAWVFIYPGVCFCSLRNAVFAWSLAELIRFSYYLFKDAPIIKTLRYNGFLVLYPFGITGEVRLVERYLEKNPDQLFLLRGIQAILLVGCAFLYLQMLRSRGKPIRIVETKGRASSPTSRHKRE